MSKYDNDRQLDRLIRRALKQNEEAQNRIILQDSAYSPDQSAVQGAYRLYIAKRKAASAHRNTVRHIPRVKRIAVMRASLAVLLVAAAILVLALASPAIQTYIKGRHEDRTLTFEAGGRTVLLLPVSQPEEADEETISTPSAAVSGRPVTEATPDPSITVEPTATPEPAPFTVQPLEIRPVQEEYSFKIVNHDAFTMVEFYLWQDDYAVSLNRLDAYLQYESETTITLTSEDIERGGTFHLRACFTTGTRWLYEDGYYISYNPDPKYTNWSDIKLQDLIGHTLVIYNGEDGSSVRYRIE